MSTEDKLRAMPVVTVEQIVYFRVTAFKHISDLNLEIQRLKKLLPTPQEQ